MTGNDSDPLRFTIVEDHSNYCVGYFGDHKSTLWIVGKSPAADQYLEQKENKPARILNLSEDGQTEFFNRAALAVARARREGRELTPEEISDIESAPQTREPKGPAVVLQFPEKDQQ